MRSILNLSLGWVHLSRGSTFVYKTIRCSFWVWLCIDLMNGINVDDQSWQYLRVDGYWQEYLNFQGKASGKGTGYKRTSSILRQSTTTHFHTISESEKASYVAHINNYLAEDPFLKSYLPIDPKTNQLFELAKDGVLLWYGLQHLKASLIWVIGRGIVVLYFYHLVDHCSLVSVSYFATSFTVNWLMLLCGGQ